MATTTTTARTTAAAERESDAATEQLDRVRDALSGLLYGTVTVIVHDGAVVQIDRTEKVRLGRSATAGN